MPRTTTERSTIRVIWDELVAGRFSGLVGWSFKAEGLSCQYQLAWVAVIRLVFNPPQDKLLYLLFPEPTVIFLLGCRRHICSLLVLIVHAIYQCRG